MQIKRGILFLLLVLSLLQLSATTPFGKEISAVKWDSPLAKKRFQRLILIKQGEILNQSLLKRTIKLIYATGKIQQISATTTFETDGKVIVTLHATPQHFISAIKITGNSAFSDKTIRKKIDLHKRVAWVENDANGVREKIILYYQQEGYAHPQVTLETAYLSSWKVQINITIIEGKRDDITQFIYETNCYPRLLRRIKTEISLGYKGSSFTNTTLTKITQRITSILANYGYHAPLIETEGKGVDTLSVNIETGPIFRLNVIGNRALSENTLKNYIISLNRKTIQTEKTVKKLKILYHIFGFPDVKVHFIVERVNDGVRGEIQTMSCRIDEGKRRFISHYHFNGQQQLEKKMLQKRISNFVYDLIVEENLPQLFGDLETVFDTHKTSYHDSVSMPTAGMTIPVEFIAQLKPFITSIYRKHGYLEATVSRVSVEEKDGELLFVADIEEFEQTMIAAVDILTEKSDIGAALKEKLQLNGGRPYNQEIEEDYAQRIKNALEEKGYFYASISLSKRRVDNNIYLSYEIDNLFPVRVGVVVFNGNYKTSDWLLKRIVRFNKGSFITKASIKNIRKNLQNTGFFRFVRISFIDSDLAATEKDMIVTLFEAYTGKISPGVGVSTDEGVFVFGKLQFSNIAGSGLTLKTSLKLGRKIDYFMPTSFRALYQNGFSEWEKIDRNITFTLLMPDMLIFPIQISMQIDAFHIHLIKSNAGSPYLKEKNGMMLLFYRRFLDHFFISLGNEFFYQNEKEYNQNSQTIYIDRLLVSPQFKAEIDFRNNLFFPSKGIKIWTSIENQTALAGTSSSFTKLENSIAGYLPLTYKKNYMGKYIPQDLLIFHSFFNFSIIFLHEGKLSQDDALKLGGNSSMRGYYAEMMFPQDNQTKDARGTLVYYLRNELRLKLYDNFYAITFLDMGNIWSDISDLGDYEAFRFSAGGGIAYVSPIGSLNLQLGFNLNPRNYEDKFAIHAYISSQ